MDNIKESNKEAFLQNFDFYNFEIDCKFHKKDVKVSINKGKR